MWRPTLPILASAVLAACTGSTDTAPTTVTVTPTSNPNQIECSNVERAYNAWKWDPLADPAWFRVTRLRTLIDDGDDFATAIKGYTDGPALALSVDVATYNLALSVLNAQFAARGTADSTATGNVEDGVAKIHGSFASFKTETCG